MNMMNFKEFCNAVADDIAGYLPQDFEVKNISLQDVAKNNETLTGLVIMGTSNVCPNIYLNGFYEKYKNGTSYEDILEQIADLRVNADIPDSFDIENIRDFENVSCKIIPRVVSIEGNTELLIDRPYVQMADLAVTFAILLDDNDMFANAGTGSIPVSESILEMWDMTAEDLYSYAVKNIRNTSTFRGMTEVMMEMMDDFPAEMMSAPEDERMFVISNNRKLFGAAALCDKEFMADVINKMDGKDFFILPSSVHECLAVVVDDNNEEIENLRNIVRDVNDTQVVPAERLSYSVYKYTMENGLQVA